METIANLAHSAAQTASSAAQTATKAVWGERQSHEEPVSGKMGNVAKGEPYDAGNIESNDAALKAGEQEDTEDTERMGTEASANTAMPDKPASGIPGAGPAVAAAAAVPGPEDDKKLQSSREEKPTTIPGTRENLGKEMPHEKESEEKPQKEEARTAAQPFSPAGPAKNAPPAISMRDDSTTAQSDTRAPASAPSSSEESNKQGTTTTAADIITGPTVRKPVAVHDEQKAKAPNQHVSPDVDTSGPGPRPLQDIAREHGWDAGATKKPESTPQIGTSDMAQRAGLEEGVEGHRRKDSAKSLGGEAGGAGETKLAMRGKEVGGEQYVHASGLKADGGDFDASRPGAGREADRLLDEKGVHHGKEVGRGQEAEHNGKEKHSLKDKIKAKLHKTHMAP